MAELIEEAHERAIEVLHRCATPFGFRASGLSPGYPQIWARDNVIISLGAVLCGDSHLQGTFRAAIDTLGSHQSPQGLIPLNVNPETGEISTENAGAVDATLWYILGHYYHYLRSGDLSYLRSHWPRLHQALTWLRYQDMNECGFHVAALVKMGWREQAEKTLHALAVANRFGLREEWEFNEWLHGETGQPMGYAYQGWSAGMYLYAYDAVSTGEVPLFDTLGLEKGGDH